MISASGTFLRPLRVFYPVFGLGMVGFGIAFLVIAASIPGADPQVYALGRAGSTLELTGFGKPHAYVPAGTSLNGSECTVRTTEGRTRDGGIGIDPFNRDLTVDGRRWVSAVSLGRVTTGTQVTCTGWEGDVLIARDRLLPRIGLAGLTLFVALGSTLMFFSGRAVHRAHRRALTAGPQHA